MAKDFTDKSFDLVYIDADHSYQNVSNDITAWLPKVKPNGVLCGHDCQLDYRKLTSRQRELLNERLNVYKFDYKQLGMSIPPEEEWWDFPHVHGGSVKAVWEVFQDRFDLPRKQSSIWSVRVD